MSETVCAVLPTCNNLDELRLCVDSLRAQSAFLARIFVCVDGSTDGTLDYLDRLSARDSRVRALSHPRNVHRGRAATRNLALPHLEGTAFVWFVDSDMRFATGALARHLEVSEGSGAVSVGAVVYDNAREALWAGYLATRGRHRFASGESLPIMHFTTANSLVRTEDVLAIDGFDERFEGYGGEDIEFAIRLQEIRGARFVNNVDAVAVTTEEKAMEQAMQQFEAFGATNLHLLESLHPEVPRTFELQRMSSPRLVDRLFVALQNPITDLVVDKTLRYLPISLRNLGLSYKVIRSVWKGYMSAHDGRLPEPGSS